MTRCWEEEPHSRPSFTSLAASVSNLLSDDYKKVFHPHFFSTSTVLLNNKQQCLTVGCLFQRYGQLAQNFQASHQSVGRPTEGQSLNTGPYQPDHTQVRLTHHSLSGLHRQSHISGRGKPNGDGARGGRPHPELLHHPCL